MAENTNRQLFVNTLILHSRLIVTAVCGLFTTRFALEALGNVDFGLFSVIASIISFVAIVNTIMVSTSHRFIAVAVGKGDIAEANKQFNLCLMIHLLIALFTIIIALPIGEWYINLYLNYAGDIHNAIMVFRYTIIASAITFFGVPYYGLLTAKEKFWVFCVPDIISHLLKFLMAYLIISHFENKLQVYALSLAILTASPVLVYVLYCRRYYPALSKISIIKKPKEYKEIFAFSGWVTYGAIAYVGKAQGAALLVNYYFSTIMNTALGIANSINGIIVNFAQSIAQPIAPQITKAYSVGNYDRCNTLLVLSTKLTFLFMLLISSPFLVETKWILEIWLGNVPDYAVMFTILIITDALVDSLNSGIKNIIFASGNIKLFQIGGSTIKLLAIVVAYLFLREGFEAYSVIYVYIVFSILVFFCNQWVLKKTLNYEGSYLWKKSYIPSLTIVVLFLPCLLISGKIPPIVTIVITFLYLLILNFYIGFSKNEREYIISVFLKRKK